VSNPEKHGISRFVSWYSGCGGDMIITKGGFDVNQQKIGEFLKHLRKEQGLTQEQLAEAFYVSSRTVSRWETGSNMPDLEILIELADFYHVDIREIIDGERKSGNMDNETKDTLKKVAEYAAEEKKRIKNKLTDIITVAAIVMLCTFVLFHKPSEGLLLGIVPEHICSAIMWTVIGITAVLETIFYLHKFGVFDKFINRKMSNRKK
jgi:transcriptional regulator with XRE-family HTH domain